MSTSEEVLFNSDNGVATITFNRPEALNALSFDVVEQLIDLVGRVTTDASIRCLVITGNGRGFCAGADVKKMLSPAALAGGHTPQGLALATADKLHRAITDIRRMPKPVICAINGPAAGAGVGLALSGDIVWAATSATFSLSYTAIGLCPDGGTTHFVTRSIGPRLAMELFLTNRKITADEALAAKMITRVLPDDTLIAEVKTLATQLATGATRAYAEAKALVNHALDNSLESQLEDERQAISRTVTSADFAEGVMAFIQKRPAQFKGQ